MLVCVCVWGGGGASNLIGPKLILAVLKTYSIRLKKTSETASWQRVCQNIIMQFMILCFKKSKN